MDLTFQVPLQYCSLQHQTLVITSHIQTGPCFHFRSISSFFLELFLHSCAVAYWAPTNQGSSSFSVISFCIFILFLRFSRQEYWGGFHSLLQRTTLCQNSPPWRMFKLPHNCTYYTLEQSNSQILWVRLQQHINWELPDVRTDLERSKNQRSNCQRLLNHRKFNKVPEKYLLLLYWLCQSLWLCGSQQTVENS